MMPQPPQPPEPPQQQASPANHNPRANPLELVVPNPKLRLMDQVREVLRVRHYAIRTETCATATGFDATFASIKCARGMSSCPAQSKWRNS